MSQHFGSFATQSTMLAAGGEDGEKKYKHPLRWEGDFTVPRYRAVLGNGKHMPVVDGLYEEEFLWDRGGCIKFSYRNTDPHPMPTSYTVDWHALQENDPVSGKKVPVKSSRQAVRLPHLPPPAAMVKKTISVVERKTPFTGYFCEKEILTAPEKQTKRGGQLAQNSKVPAQLTDKQILATRTLWRQASTGDVYFKEGGTDVPGISTALKDGAVLDWKNPTCNHMTLFLFTCYQNDKDLAKYLLGLGADPKVVDGSKRNVFHHCARQNGTDVLVFLLRTLDPKDIGLLITQKDEDGDTPLHKAAEKGSLVICQLLIKMKSTDLITLLNKRDQIPFDVARSYKMHHLFKLLNPLEYVKDQTSLIARIRNKLGTEGVTEVAEGGGGDDDEEDEEEESGGGGGSGPLSNLSGLDRKCNQDRKAVIEEATKGKKGGKKGKKGGKKKK
ncbi:unnamed protein product [Amoebophrya sp. A120]|nr:unnamed protein product [Amoebophrya sp. A120]|eukprot:GSA120T00023068001.1